MKIVISADLHLSKLGDSPERLSALERIINQMRNLEIGLMIISGDLFDSFNRNYSEFEKTCHDNQNIKFLVVPGNHDQSLSNTQIVAPNINIFTRPTILRLNDGGPQFFFLPYEKNRTMGERIAEYASQLLPDNWILIAHGDWLDGVQDPNPYESGFYMPLTRKDIEIFKPKKVFLGHIHAPMDRPPIYYTGSPCGLDIGETGPRRFLIYDTVSDMVESRHVETDVLYYDETITVLPLDDEESYLRLKANAIIRKWNLAIEDQKKVRLRLKVTGFSSNREELLRVIKEYFSNYSYFKNEEPDIAAVSFSTDSDRSQLAEIIRERIQTQVWSSDGDEPSTDEVLMAALEIIYGGK